MNDTASELLRRSQEAMTSLQRLEVAAATSAGLRAWAQAHFAALMAIERAAGRLAAPPPSPREVADDGLYAALLRGLRECFAAETEGSDDAEDDAAGRALRALMEIAGAQRGFVAALQDDGALAFPSARSFCAVELGEPEAEVSRTILEAAIRGGGRPLVVDDARADARFAGTPSVQRLAVRAVLAVPLMDEGRAYGVVYLDRPADAEAFDPRRREATEAFAAAIASPLRRAIENEPRTRAPAPRSRLAQLRARHDLAGLDGDSPVLTAVAERLVAVAPTDAPVLITGETGVGKELCARLLHRNSRRAAGPWVALRCAGVPALFGERLAAAIAASRGGTLVIDGIDALSPADQGALAAELDAERTRRSGARVLATSQRDLQGLTAAATLRPDLLYRVGVVELAVPPLRERARDLAAIARALLAAAAERRAEPPRRLDHEALARLERYPWPGNVRELEGALTSALLRADAVITADCLPAPIREHEAVAPASSVGLKEAVRAFRRRFVERAMTRSGWDHKQAAAALGVHPKYLFKLLRELRDDA
ncbi:MAG: sigma 54-interacting transcriptional regulator [Nannocystaceae bacterium]